MKKKIGILSLILVVIAVLVGVKFGTTDDSWEGIEVAKESLKNLKKAEGYAVERKIESKMVTPQNETLEDAVLETYHTKIDSNGLVKLDYIDEQVMNGKIRKLGKATFYFNKDNVYSDKNSQLYNWLAEEILEEESLKIAENKLQLFVDDLELNQSGKIVTEAEVKEELRDEQYVITIKYEDATGTLQSSTTLYIDENSKEPVKLEVKDNSNGFQISETYQWGNINDVEDIIIPKEAESFTNH
ncbi:hypothetical protein [Virgibacillus halodenitrificans]|uniref:hypothetical protein n=1 Tax=Virgibacillus halodenitrificans TaxID=1482 RepID=UPI000EF49093|nr:hypothetical protein [Virgibacillus halodenitrificans]